MADFLSRPLFGIDNFSIASEPLPDYTTSASVKTLDDPRFHADLRDYYEGRGISGTTEELIDRWRSDNRWREANIASTAFAAGRSALASERQNELEARLASVWNAQPMFWEEGGAGWIDALGDYVPAALLDPTNLFTLGKAGAVGLRAASIASAKGQNALLAGVSRGALEGAKWEGALNAAVGGAQSVLEQGREQNLGMSDGFSLARTATDAAIGGVIGGAFGGVMGGVAGGVASRGAGRAVENLTGLGYTPDEIAGFRPGEFERVLQTNEQNPRVLEEQAAEQERLAAERAALQQQAAQEMGPKQMSAEDIIRTTRSEIEADYLEARRAVLEEQDPAARDRKIAIAEDFQTQLVSLDQLARAPARMTALSERVNQLSTTIPNDPEAAAAMRSTAERLTRSLIDLQVDYRRMATGSALHEIPTFLNQLRTFEEEIMAAPGAAKARGTLAPDPTQQATPQATQTTPQPAAPQSAPQAAAPAAPAQAAAPAAQPASPGAQPAAQATPRPAQAAAPAQAADPAQAAAVAPAPTPQQRVAEFLRQAGPETTVAKIKAGTGLDQTTVTQAIQAAGGAVTRRGNKVIINNADALPQPEPTPAAPQQPAPAPAQSATAPAPDPVFARVRDFVNTQPDTTPERVVASIPDVTPAQAKLYLDQLVAEGALSAPTSTGLYVSRTAAPVVPETLNVSKPARRRAAEMQVPVDMLPPGAKVEDVDRIAKEAGPAAKTQYDADRDALDSVLTEYSQLIPPKIVEEMRLFDDVDFMRALLRADPRTAPRFDAIFSFYQSTRDAAELEMRIGKAGMKLSAEDAEVLMSRRIDDLVKLQLERDPDADEATVREVITAAYLNRQAGEAGDPDRPPPSPAAAEIADKRRMTRAGGPGTDSTTAGRDPNTGRIQSIIKWGRDLSDTSGSIVQAGGRQENQNLSRVRLPTYIQAPARGQFAAEEALLQAQASVERAAQHNAALDRRIQNLARAAAETAAKKATDAERAAIGARREEVIQRLRQQIKDLKASGRSNIGKELRSLEERVANEINAPDPVYVRAYNEVIENPRPALEAWARNQAKRDVAEIAARNKDLGREMDPARIKSLTAEKEAAYLRQIEPQAGVDVAAFVATGADNVKFAGGRDRPTKGQVAYIDALTGKVYPDLYSLYIRRPEMTPELARQAAERAVGLQPSVVADPRLAPTTASDPYQPIREAINKFKADGNLAKFRAVLEKYADPAVLNRDAPTAPSKYPGIKNGRVAALIPLDPNARVRILPFEAAKKATAEDFVEPGKTIEDYEVIYVSPSQSKAQREQEIAAARIEIAAKGRERAAAGDQMGAAAAADPATITPAPQTMAIDTFEDMRVAVPDAERAAMVNTLVDIKGLARADAEVRVNEMTGGEIVELLDQIEMTGLVVRDARGNEIAPRPNSKRGWPQDIASYERRFAAIKALNNTIASVAPAGIARNAISRADSLKALRTALSGLPADRVKVIERVFSSFISREAGAPLIGRSDPNSAGAGYSPLTNSLRAPHVANFDVLMPGELKILHEMAHWSYFNVLTPADRVEFWASLRKFYGEDGKLDTKRLNAMTPPGIENANLNPQEMLANQFTAFASGKLIPEAGEQSLWQRVVGYMQALFDWFVKKRPVDPALVPTLAKMLPEDERIKMAAADISAPPPPAKTVNTSWEMAQPTRVETNIATPEPSKNAAPPAYDPAKALESARANLFMVNDMKAAWERAIDAGNYDALIEVAKETSSWLMASKDMFWVHRKPVGDEKGFNWASYYITRSQDIQAILNQKAGAAPANQSTQGERATAAGIDGRVDDPKRKFEQLRQLYRTGHAISADQQLRAQRGEEAVFEGRFANHRGVGRSSMSWLFDQASNDLNGFMARLDGRTPSATPEAVKPAKTIDPQAAEIAAKAVDATVDKRMADKAAKTIDAAAKGRGRRKGAPKAALAQIGGQSIEGMSLDELRNLYTRVEGTEAAAAVEAQVRLIMRSGDPADFQARLGDLPDARLNSMKRLSKADLISAYTKAVETGDATSADIAAYEMARRRVTRDASTAKVQQAKATELQMRIGLPSHVGIPASAPATLQEFLSRMTHRSSVDEATTRTMALRLAIVGRGQGPLVRGDIARMAGVDIDPDGMLDLVSYEGEEFRALRNQLRRLASSLDEDGTTPAPQVVQQVAEMAIRAVDVDNRLAQEPNLATNIAEHFRHGMSRRAMIEELSDPALAAKLDEAIETARHITSGLVGRADIRGEYPGLVAGSDILARDPSPIASRFQSDAVPASIVADYVDELRRVGGETYQTNVQAFTGAGVGNGRVFYQLPDGTLSETPQPAGAGRMGSVTEQLMDELIVQEEAAASALRSALIDGDMSTVAAASERIAAIRDLAREGNGPNTTVAPVYLKANAVARFDDTALHRPTDALVKSIVRDMVASGRIGQLQGEQFMAQLPPEGVSGTQLWEMIGDTAGDGAAVSTLRSMGYDGYKSPDGRIHVFETASVRPVDDNSFYTSLMPINTDTRGILGDVVAAAVMTDGKPKSWAPVADELELRIGMPSVVTRALSAIGADKSVTNTERLEVQRANVGTILLGANSERLRRTGGRHWLADFAETHFQKFNEDLGKRLFDTKTGLLARLHDLDDSNVVKRWARKASPFFTLGKTAPTQPESHFRIVAALRQPSGSMHEKALKPREMAVYRQIRTAMQEELRRLRDVGVPVGNMGPDYFPQVWSAEQITADSGQFIQAMREYYRIESEYYGRPYDEAKAQTFAENVYLTMSDQGVDGHMVERSGHSFSATADHLDHARLINLQLPGAGKLLEPFLETDLESLIVKYFDASTRRRLFTEQFGNNAHGFRDYQAIAIEGREPIVKMLMTNKVLRRTSRRFNPEMGAVVDDERAVLEYTAPFKDRPDLATDFVDRLVAMDPVAAKQELLDLLRNRDGSVPQAWQRRAEAISAALADFKGQPVRLHADEHTFEEQLMRAMMRKPLSSNQALIDTSRFIRNFNSVTLLGFTMLSSFGDVVLPLVRSGEFRATMKAWAKYRSDPSYRRLMEGTGVAMESILNERLTHLYGAGTGRFTNAFFWLNGLTPWTNTMRKVSAAVGHQTFVAMQDKAQRYHSPNLSIDKQHPQFKVAYRFLKRYGLEEFATSRTSLESEALLREDTRLRMAINKFTDEAVFSPNPNDIPLWAQTPVGAMVAQLKAFPLMMQRLAKTVLVDDVMDAVKAAREDGIQGLAANAPKRALALLAVAPAFGAASLAAADIARGRGGEDNDAHELRTRNLAQSLGAPGNQAGDESDFWGWYVESLMMVGGLGLLGDMFHKTAQNIDNGAFGFQRTMSLVFGPTVGTINSGFNVTAGAYDFAIGGKESNAPERTAMREVLMRLPIAGGIVSQREALIDNTIGEANTE